MKSRISFFNRGLCLSLLRRCWPVWTSYFVLLLLLDPGSLMQIVEDSRRYSNIYSNEPGYLFRQLNRNLLSSGTDMAIISFFVCVLVVMAMFSFMYNKRSTGMYCSMPLKRETVFITAFVTGLVPMLIIDVLIALICLAFFSGEGMLATENIWLFLSMTVMSNVAFDGMAAFCAVLTGHILVLPAVYVVLNMASSAAETGIMAIRSALVYGYAGGSGDNAFSPIITIANRLNLQTMWQRDIEGNMFETGEYVINGYSWLVVYCIAGLVLAALAVLIYRRRQMESCGDVVAIKILKPIFRYCMCFGVSTMFALCVYSLLFDSYMTGRAEAACYLGLLLFGAFVGYFVAEMLMQKTLRVFRGKWKGFIISCLAFCAFVAVCEFDLTGYEKRLPDAEAVESVKLDYHEGCDFSQPENIRAMIDFHRSIIEEKDINENANFRNIIRIEYKLKDGSSLKREYPLSFEDAQRQDENSSLMKLCSVVNLQEAIEGRAKTVAPVTEKNALDASLEGSRINANGEREYFSYPLSNSELAEFYNECILPDVAEGKLCRLFPVNTEEYYNKVSSVSLHFGLNYDGEDGWNRSYKSYTIYMDAQRCCEWIAENTDIKLYSMAEIDPEGMSRELGNTYLQPVPTVEAAEAVAVRTLPATPQP